MSHVPKIRPLAAARVAILFLASHLAAVSAEAQPTGPAMLDARRHVRTVVAGIGAPTSLAFIGPDDFLVLEKNSGRVLRVTDGVIEGEVLDLAVNAGSERGLLGIALHPDFPANPGVYLY